MEAQRLLVISDTHGHVHALTTVFKWAKDGRQIKAAVFLGDGIPDLASAETASGFSCEWKMVRGNNDHEYSIPLSDIFDFGGHRFFLSHGHRGALYSGYHTLAAAAGNLEAEAALFGHTHVPCLESSGGILLINPGSVGRPRSEAGSTFAVIGCEAGEPLTVEFWRTDVKGKIERLKKI